MGSELMSSYLRRRLSSSLAEAEADFGRLPFIDLSKIVSRIRSIEDTYFFIPIDQLYELIDVLSECRIFALKPHKRVAIPTLLRLRGPLIGIESKLRTTTPPQDSVNGRGTVEHTSPNFPDPALIFGFDSQVKEIEGVLLPDSSAVAPAMPDGEDEDREAAKGVTAIGITGRCGSGKTALAQKVFASRRIQEEFSPRIWVCLSDLLFDRVKVLEYILGEIECDVSELRNPRVFELLEKLQCGLMGKRFLIILDDAWRMDEFYADIGCSVRRDGESFASGLPKGSGGAVVVTGRGEDGVGRMVGEKHVIRPRLGEDICWDIFCTAVREQGKMEALDHLDDMKEDVIRSCDGLPLAAKTLAKIIPDLL